MKTIFKVLATLIGKFFGRIYTSFSDYCEYARDAVVLSDAIAKLSIGEEIDEDIKS